MDDIGDWSVVSGRHLQVMVGASASASTFNILKGLGLQSNLRLCLDAGDSASYNPVAQPYQWLDTAAGNNFWRGNSSIGNMFAPQFNGVAGHLSPNEYWSSNGYGCFTWVAGPAVMPAGWSNMHKAIARFTIFSWMRTPIVPVGQYLVLFDTRANADLTGPGVVFYLTGSGSSTVLAFQILNDSGAAITPTTSGIFLAPNVLSMVSVSIDAVGVTAFFGINGSYASFNSALLSASYSSANPVRVPFIGATNTTQAFLPIGSRLYSIAIIEGISLTQAQISNIFNANRGRFGV
jgi:hypothetical protein